MKKTMLLFSALTCLFSMNTAVAQKKEKTTTLFHQKLQTPAHKSGIIKCGSTEYEMANQEKFKNRANNEGFEKWLAPKIEEIKKAKANGKSANVVLTIPVVVHVLHNNEEVGTGTNLSDLRVQSQITVLNQDFRRMLNTNGYNTNAVGADVEIEFCLAQQNPDGAPSNGIDRVYTGPIEGEDDLDYNIKPRTIWNPNRYLNIWIGDISSTNLLGYAYFPDTNVIPGLQGMSSDPTADGVVINCYAFGSSEIVPGPYFADYSLGRTTTHEMGHFLGLRHIWGDNNSCIVNNTDSYNDFCLDTPAASRANYSCEPGLNSCTAAAGLDMTENYMDYSTDGCLNLFTVDQKNRIRAVLANAPRRLSLTTSNACTPGQLYGLNGGLKIDNTTYYCSNNIAPKIVLNNAGTTTLTTAVINYTINGTSGTYNWTGSLAINQTIDITLPQVTLLNGVNNMTATIQSVNGTLDQYDLNNTATWSYQHITSGTFNTSQVQLTIQNDIYPEDIFWALYNLNTGTVVDYGQFDALPTGTTTLPPVFVKNIAVAANTCYVLVLQDEIGDGMNSGYGVGYYKLKTMEGVLITEGGDFADYEEKDFKINSTTASISDTILEEAIKLYPNPTNNVLHVKLDREMTVSAYQITNQLGQIVKSNASVDANEFSIDVNSIANGVYFINIKVDGAQKTLKFIKN